MQGQKRATPAAALLCAFAIAAPLDTRALNLAVPLGCDYGENCYISRYFDHETEEEGAYSDYTCGRLSADGYTATDFILEDFTLFERGIPVLAADSGVVEEARANMQDVAVSLVGEEAVRGRECGNGVRIRHPRGYVTQYCHLREGSVTVQRGEAVEQGQTIGEIGVSGKTDYPYMAFTVFRKGQPMDPFTGEDPITDSINVPCGSADTYPLWDRKTEKRLSYIPAATLASGFAHSPANARAARRGKFRETALRPGERFIVFWADIFGVSLGDKISISILDPLGKPVKEDMREAGVSGAQRYFQRITARRPGKAWLPGDYKGVIEVKRRAGEYVASDVTVVKSERNISLPAAKQAHK